MNKGCTGEDLYVVSRDGRAIKKHIESRYYSDRPDNGDADLKPARARAIEEPALILLKQQGSKEDGWNNAPFWWPVLIVQQNVETSVFAAEIEDK